jgi:DNA polymerase-3 subunit beta
VRLRAGVGPHEGVYTIATDPLNVIPEIKFESKHTIVTTADRLLRIISKTLFCCSTDELRPSMMGVLFQFSTAGTTAVATDGHRLCRIALSDFTSSIDSNVIVPAKALSIIAKSFDPSEEVTINFSTESICFRSTSTYITSRLIDERYPNYEAVIPRENDKTLIVSRDRVAQSLKRTRIFANQNLQIQFILHEDSLNVQVDNAKADRYASEIIGCDYQSDDLTIGFNSRFIEEAFSHFDDDDIVIKFSTPVRAAVLEQSQREGERLLMLVMPVKLNS